MLISATTPIKIETLLHASNTTAMLSKGRHKVELSIHANINKLNSKLGAAAKVPPAGAA